MSAIVLHLPTVTFHRKSKSSSKDAVKVSPIVVDFGRLLKSANKNLQEVVPGIPNADLLHATASLYGISLSEVTDDVIYPTLCEKWSKSILMIADEEEAKERLRGRLVKNPSKEGSNVAREGQPGRLLHERSAEMKRAEDNDRFVDIFSDEEESADGEDSGEEEDDYMAGVGDFLRSVDRRREDQRRWVENSGVNGESPPLGVESRLIGCASFERSYDRPGEKVLQLTLVAVRRKYRELGIGSFLIKQLLDPSVTGGSDVIVVNADHNAVEFFERHGFTDDVILNSRYAHIGDIWFNSKRMCYLGGFSHALGERPPDPFFNLREMEMEISLWKERSVQAYQQFASIVYRMRREILTLHARVALQDETIARFRRSDPEVEEAELRRRIGELREAIDSMKDGSVEESRLTSSSAHDVTSMTSSSNFGCESLPTSGDVARGDARVTSEQVDDMELLTKFAAEETSTSSGDLMRCGEGGEDGLRKQATTQRDFIIPDGSSRPITQPSLDGVPLSPPPYVPASSNIWVPSPSAAWALPTQAQPHSSMKEDVESLFLHEVKHCFLASFTEQQLDDVIDVHDVNSATLPAGVVTRFDDAVTSSHDPDMVATLYFCDATDRCKDSESFKRIMSQGFRTDDFTEGNFGRGLYFSRHARCAAHFSPSGLIIVAKVCLGRTQTLTAKDPHRRFPPEGHDSILTQGRLAETGTRHGVTTHSEYIIFEAHQALPVAMVKYSLHN